MNKVEHTLSSSTTSIGGSPSGSSTDGDDNGLDGDGGLRGVGDAVKERRQYHDDQQPSNRMGDTKARKPTSKWERD
jgi:hypothetical protein